MDRSVSSLHWITEYIWPGSSSEHKVYFRASVCQLRRNVWISRCRRMRDLFACSMTTKMLGQLPEQAYLT